MISNLRVTVNENIYIKDPESSELGKRIISEGIDFMNDVGYECFTFKKLASRINTSEASVYRYFENKHKFLLYLTSWYWRWMEYKLQILTANLSSAEKLNRAIELLTTRRQGENQTDQFDEEKLNRIVIQESNKTYLTKEVDEVNKFGVYGAYKQIVQRVSDIILEINPKFKYPHMLASTVIEGAQHQRFFSDHLPRLTDSLEGEDSIVNFYKELAFKTIS